MGRSDRRLVGGSKVRALAACCRKAVLGPLHRRSELGVVAQAKGVVHVGSRAGVWDEAARRVDLGEAIYTT